MKNNDALKASAYQRLVKGHDWTFRDEGYFSPRDNEQYSFTNSSVSEDYESSFREYDDQKTSSPTSYGYFAVANLVQTTHSSTREEAPQKPHDIHDKLEEMLQRRLHGAPVAKSAHMTQTEISSRSNTSSKSLRPMEAIDRSVCSGSFHGVQDAHGLHNGFRGNVPQQTYYSTAEQLHHGAEKGKKLPYNPKLAISHVYSESAKLKKQRLLQELSSSFRTPEVDERHGTYEDLTTAYQEPYESSEEGWNKFKSDTLRDTHADSDTSPINKANVVRMLTKHLGGEPVVDKGKLNRSANDLTNLFKTKLTTKRASVYEVFKFNSEDIRSDLGDNVENLDEDEEIIQALNNDRRSPLKGERKTQSTLVRQGTRNGVHLASSGQTDYGKPHRAIGINKVYRQNSVSDAPARTVENSASNVTSLQEKPQVTAPSFQSCALSPRNSLYLGSFSEQKQERANQTEFLHEHPMQRTGDLRSRECAEEMGATVVSSMVNSSPTAPTKCENKDFTEYYDPKSNDESLIKPSQFKRHSFGTMIGRPIHIHQNIPGTDPPAYVPQGSARQSWKSLERSKVQDSSLVVISEQAKLHNHQTFSELMGICPATLPTRGSTSASEGNVLYHHKLEHVDHSPINETVNDKAKDKWYNSWRNRRLREDKDYASDAESVSSSRSGSKSSRSNRSSRSNTPRSRSPMLTLLKSLSSKFSPSLGRSGHRQDLSIKERMDDGGLFLPESRDEVQRRIRMNGIVKESYESKIGVHRNLESDDVALGEFVSARDWLEKQRESFDFRCVRPEIQNRGIESRNNTDAMGMPHIKQAIVPGLVTPRREKSKISVKRESIGRLMVPAVFGGGDKFAINKELLGADSNSKPASAPNHPHVSHMEYDDEKRVTKGAITDQVHSQETFRFMLLKLI